MAPFKSCLSFILKIHITFVYYTLVQFPDSLRFWQQKYKSIIYLEITKNLILKLVLVVKGLGVSGHLYIFRLKQIGDSAGQPFVFNGTLGFLANLFNLLANFFCFGLFWKSVVCLCWQQPVFAFILIHLSINCFSSYFLYLIFLFLLYFETRFIIGRWLFLSFACKIIQMFQLHQIKSNQNKTKEKRPENNNNKKLQ